MINTRHGLGFLGALIASSFIGVPPARSADESNAQPNATANESALGEIVVTAQKRSERLQDVGLTVSALSPDALAAQRISSLSDIANAVPGLVYTQTSTATPVYILRGVGFNDGTLAASPDVATYLDQVPLPFPITATLTAFDLERVEVLKGPQGTLFGENATGGAINFVAAKPSSTFGGGGSIGYASFNTIETSGYLTGALTDTLNGRIAFKAVKGDDWQKSYTRSDTIGKADNQAARLLFDWKPTDKLTVALDVNGWLDRDDPQVPQLYKVTPLNPVGSTGLAGSVPANLPVLSYPVAPQNDQAADWAPGARPYKSNSFWQTSVRTDYAISPDLMLTSLTSYLHLSVRSSVAFDGTDTQDYDLEAELGDVKSFSEEIRLANSGSGPLRWVVGSNYDNSDTEESTLDISRGSTSAAVNGFGQSFFTNSQSIHDLAAFAHADYTFFDKLTLKGGARYTRSDRSDASANQQDLAYTDNLPYTVTQFFNIVWPSIYPNYRPIRPGQPFTLDNRVDANGQPVNAATYGQAGTFHGGLDEHNVSWSAGLDYKLTPDVLLYANASRGYKAGGFAQVAAAVWTQFAPIKQESVMAYEGGIKTELLDRSVTLNAAGFYYDYSDKQVRGKFVDPIFGLLDALVSVPKSKIYGAEFDTAFRPMRSLTIGAAATYLNSRVEQYNGVVNFAIVDGLHVPVTASFAGARLPFAPTWQGILTAEYEQPLSARLTGFVGANLTAQTSSYAILAITDADKSNYAVPSRALTGVNLGVESADHQWKTMIWGKNIFDRYYTINTLLPVDTLVRYAGRPAEWGLTVSGRF